MPSCSPQIATRAWPEETSPDIRDFLACSVDILMSLDPVGRIRYVSSSYANLTGHHPSEACGRSCLEYVSEADIGRTAGEIAWVLENGSEIDGFENLVRAKDGSFRIVSWRGKRASDGNLCAVGRDITQQKSADERTVTAQRWDAVNQLAGGVAHEFNNILAGVLGYLEIASRLASDERLKRILDTALAAGRRGANTIEKMLLAARMQQLKPELVDLQAIVAGLADAISAATRPKATVHYDIFSGALPVRIDVTQLQVCIVSLCANAAESIASTGDIRIATQLEVITSSPGELGLGPGEYARLTVSDTGRGMSPEAAKRCFEPFYTTRGVDHGRGLGLSHVYGVIAQSGGMVRLDSHLGQGTTVNVLLPLSAGRIEEKALR
jgi:PAS domain S-box-containing protein